MSKRNVRRRDFLALSMTAGGMFALAACSPAATPTAAPKAAEPTKPAAPAAPATAPTTAPASAPTAAAKAAVEPTTPAAAATAAPAAAAKPTAAAQAAPPKLGASLIGKIEGPEFVLDPAAYPKAFKEAPQLADLVKAGKLPPVEKRLPEDLMVIKPLQRDRQVRRHLATRLHRPGRRPERPPSQPAATGCSTGTRPSTHNSCPTSPRPGSSAATSRL